MLFALALACSVNDVTPTPTDHPCALEDCDDGLDCSENLCDDEERCIAEPTSTCSWPATEPDDAELLAWLDSQLEQELSGATWNAEAGHLWLVRSRLPSVNAAAFRLVEDGAGGWEIDETTDGTQAIWLLDGDVEGITVPDPTSPTQVLITAEGEDRLYEYELEATAAVPGLVYDTSPYLPTQGSSGAEAITFVPDDALQSWGFTDGQGELQVSTMGMGGLVLVGHQNGGRVYAFDLDPVTADVDLVGEFTTERTETAGLEFDASTGRLLILHGDDYREIEVARLSSTEGKLDTEYVFVYPRGDNVEGIAVDPVELCESGGRRLFIAADGEGPRSAQLFADWPCF